MMDIMGYALFHDIKCVFYEDGDSLCLIKADNESSENIVRYFDERDFEFNYSSFSHEFCTAYISKIMLGFGSNIRLYPKYVVKKIDDSAVGKLEIVGDSLDAFFSPFRYFYEKKHNGDLIGSLVYEKEIADKWEINFEGSKIRIALSYGEILSRGIASDLMLHPRLEIYFPPTKDTAFIYRVYLLVVRFLQVVRNRKAQGLFSVNLYDQSNWHIGYLLDYAAEQTPYAKQSELDINYNTYKPFMSRFWQFTADNFSMSLQHFPTNFMRVNKDDYSAIDFILIFAAFESACHEQKKLYDTADMALIKTIHDKAIEQIEKCVNKSSPQEERDFISNAIQRIQQLGSNLGQKTKIVNAYKILAPALESSIENILFLHGYKGNLTDSEIKK